MEMLICSGKLRKLLQRADLVGDTNDSEKKNRSRYERLDSS